LFQPLQPSLILPISRRDMDWRDFLTFASDAELAVLWGVGFLALSLSAMLAERRRVRRAQIDRVGCMPWIAVFLASALIGSALVVMGVTGMLRG